MATGWVLITFPRYFASIAATSDDSERFVTDAAQRASRAAVGLVVAAVYVRRVARRAHLVHHVEQRVAQLRRVIHADFAVAVADDAVRDRSGERVRDQQTVSGDLEDMRIVRPPARRQL